MFMSNMHLQYHSYIVLINSYVQHVLLIHYVQHVMQERMFMSNVHLQYHLYIVLTNSHVQHVSTKSYRILLIHYVQNVSTNLNELEIRYELLCLTCTH